MMEISSKRLQTAKQQGKQGKNWMVIEMVIENLYVKVMMEIVSVVLCY